MSKYQTGRSHRFRYFSIACAPRQAPCGCHGRGFCQTQTFDVFKHFTWRCMRRGHKPIRRGLRGRNGRGFTPLAEVDKESRPRPDPFLWMPELRLRPAYVRNFAVFLFWLVAGIHPEAGGRVVGPTFLELALLLATLPSLVAAATSVEAA